MNIYWAVGFIEGEGSFSATRNGKGLKMAIEVAQVQRQPLEHLLQLFGGIIYGPKMGKHKKNPKHSPFYEWRVCGGQALHVMLEVFEFMSPRRQQQILVAIDRWSEWKGKLSGTEQDAEPARQDTLEWVSGQRENWSAGKPSERGVEATHP